MSCGAVVVAAAVAFPAVHSGAHLLYAVACTLTNAFCGVRALHV